MGRHEEDADGSAASPHAWRQGADAESAGRHGDASGGRAAPDAPESTGCRGGSGGDGGRDSGYDYDYDWKEREERCRLRKLYHEMSKYDAFDAFLTESVKNAICEDVLGEILTFL